MQPAAAEAKKLSYVDFVEPEQKKDSRRKRCESAPDNTAKCTVMFGPK